MNENPYIFLKNNFFLQFLIADRFRIYRHIVGCSLLFSFLVLTKQWGDYEGMIDHWDWIERWLGLTATFYLNMYVFIPRFFFKGKLATYIILLTLWNFFLLGGTYYLNFVIWKDYMIGREIIAATKTPASIIIFSALFYVVPFIMTSTLIKTLQIWVKDSERMQELERQANESELQALRSQIQPHFLFNMLNSINTLLYIDPEKASYTITKLSDFLRHLLYQSHEEQVFLSSELRFLSDYLSLEAMRRDDFTYEITYSEKKLQGIQIPPNILLILAENAVKHSVDTLSPTYIYIKCEEKEGFLHFSVRNSVPLEPHRKHKCSGIGLPNLNRRLELLYGKRFSLSQERLPQEYIVTLALPL